jgi:tetratricopeptide (TPR) repeat protein
VLTACVDVQLEATDVGGNRVFDSATLTSSLSASRCVEDDPHGVLDPQPLLAAARAQVVQRYLDRVLPHQEWVAVNLYQDGAFPDLQVGNGYAEVGNWAEAAEAYQRALQAMTGEQGQKRYMGLFNLGVACEFSDRFDDARNALQEAYALGRDQMILRELQRASAREGEVQRLRQQGAPAQPAR